MKEKKVDFGLFFLLLIFLFFRLYQLKYVLNFSFDQGLILTNTYKLWQTKKLTLIGIEYSFKTPWERGFFDSALPYYLFLPFLLITKWNPLSLSYFLISLNLLGLIFLYQAIKKFLDTKIAFLTCFFLAIMPKMVYHSQFIWLPNLLPFLSCLFLLIWIKIINKINLHSNHFFVGLILGLGISFHNSYFIVFLVNLVLIFIYKIKLKRLIFQGLGFLFGYSFLILFDLKHNFYNLKTIILILKYGSQKNFTFPPPFYYFLPLMPFIFLFLAIVIDKIFKKYFIVTLIILLLIGLYSAKKILPRPKNGFGMPENWNYPSEQKTSQIILRENKSNYNIASLLSGDTRDYPLRYLLTIAGNPPLPVEQYPNATFLFVTSPHDQNSTINNQVWEISSFCPCRVQKSWAIQEKISLYLLAKIN